ncbi:LOW QUALITY PROTEIN: hypothetical protein CVT26_014871 [Gymnopilus dilepis]|uniref:Uncharacterized protein n=1 Tax=Gymnopilus dilepis TaxID=231916 RepID=A0A409XX03_9AGAR|nr:LOW QUALITY PROTEIN: hypothetical protein CVT26_014871 [Gymnopilus dilepis]
MDVPIRSSAALLEKYQQYHAIRLGAGQRCANFSFVEACQGFVVGALLSFECSRAAFEGEGYVSSPWRAISTPIDASTESYGSNAKLQLALKQLLLERTSIEMQFHKSFIAFVLAAVLSAHALPVSGRVPLSRLAVMDQAPAMALAVDVPLKLVGTAQVPVMVLAVAASWKLVATVRVLATTLTTGVTWRLAAMVQALVTDMLAAMDQAPATTPTMGVAWRLAVMALDPATTLTTGAIWKPADMVPVLATDANWMLAVMAPVLVTTPTMDVA